MSAGSQIETLAAALQESRILSFSFVLWDT